jgi:hypothetical protein
MATYKTCANSAFKVLIGALTGNDNMIAEGIEEYGIIEEAAKTHLPEFVRDAVGSVEIKEPVETEADE